MSREGEAKMLSGPVFVRGKVTSVAQEGVGVKLSDHDVVEEGMRMGVVEIA